jgi:hypothetical protein
LTIAHSGLAHKLAHKKTHSLTRESSGLGKQARVPYRAAAALAMFVVLGIPAKFVIDGAAVKYEPQ